MSYLKIDEDGNKFWHNDERYLHREDGPAKELISGHKEWFLNGKRHREDGPAVEYVDDDKEWWYSNEFVGYSEYGFTQEDFERYLRELKIKEYW